MTSPPFDNSIPELTEVIVAKVVPDPPATVPLSTQFSTPISTPIVTPTVSATPPAAPAPPPYVRAHVDTTPGAPRVGIRSARRFTEPEPPPPTIVSDTIIQMPQGDLSDEDWHRVESEVRGRIAHQVLGRIDFVLEQRVRDSLADVLQTAVESLTEEIKYGLTVALEEIIADAVSKEITRSKTTKK